MDVKRFKYDVFISYRQLEPDRSVAARLHKLLEIYRVPRALVRRGVGRRLRRIFRDTDELAASSSLSESIRSALEASRFLVVVCSPRTPESRWVAEEIAIFRELGRGDQILPLLIEGIPRDSFPEGLGTAISEEGEPLAADIRSSTPSRSLRRLRREKLRIIAPVLGVEFAELERREARRLRLKLVAAVSVALAVFLTGGGIWWHGQKGIREQAGIAAKEALKARSTSLSDFARTQLEKDLSLSLLLSVEANRSAPTVQAQSSLLEALQRASGATAVLRAHGNAVEALAFSPDGGRLVSAAGDGKLIAWDMQTRQPYRLLSEDSSMRARAIAFAPRGGVMASARSGGIGGISKLALYDAQSWELLWEHSLTLRGSVNGLAFDRAGGTLVTLAGSQIVSLWDVSNLALLNQDAARGELLLGDRDGGMVSLLRNGVMSTWNGEGFDSADALGHALAEGGYGSIWSAALSPAGDRLALGFTTCGPADPNGKAMSCIRIWGLSAGEFVEGALDEQRDPHEFLAFDSDGRHLAVAQPGEHRVSVIDLESSTVRSMDVAEGAVTSLVFAPVNNALAVGTSAGIVELWEAPGRPTLGRRINQSGEVGWGAAISPDGKVVAAGSRNGTIVLWHLVDDRLNRETFSGHERAARAVAFSPGSNRMVSVGKGGLIVLRDATDATPVAPPIDAGATNVAAIALSDDGRKVAWWHGTYEELNILNLETGEGAMVELPNDSRLRAAQLQFADQDRKVLIFARDCRAVEWDIKKNSLRKLVNVEAPAGCSRVAADVDQGLVAFGMEDGSIELWDSASRRRLGRLFGGHGDAVRTLAFSSARKGLLSGDGKDVVLWDLDKDSWMALACEIANRNFSEAEWALYFRTEPYRETCGPWGAFVAPKVVARPWIDSRPIRPSEVQ